MNKFDYRWNNEAVGYNVTMNGNDVPNMFFKAKGKFDRSAADRQARQQVGRLIYAEKCYQREVVRPLTELEIEYLELVKKSGHPELWNTVTDREMERALQLNRSGLMRDSVLRLTHPYVDGVDYLLRYSAPAWKDRLV